MCVMLVEYEDCVFHPMISVFLNPVACIYCWGGGFDEVSESV